MAFVPRLTKEGIYNNPWYYGSNPFYLANFGMPNCTCYAYGRAAEIANQFLPLPLGNAGEWYYSATNFERGSTPALGAIGVWRSRSGGGKGHVAVVEQILSNGGVLFSCSGYRSTYFWTEVCYPASNMLMNYMLTRDYFFQGYIYNPYAGTETVILPDWIKGNRYLTQTEMESNAIIVWSVLYFKGWTQNAVAGLLGNMESESTINPGIWQNLIPGSAGGGGWGLVQWTPWTNFTNWASANGYDDDDGDAQLEWIDSVTTTVGQWIPTSGYNFSFDEYKTSQESPEYLASAFLRNFERPGDIPGTEPIRRSNAAKWFAYLENIDPLKPGPIDDKVTKMPLWMMLKYW